MKTENILIDSLVTDNLQVRVAMSEACIKSYAEFYSETPEEMPPVIVYYDAASDKHYLADGFHRVAAVTRNGGDTIPAEVYEGNYNDALRAALKANAKNALQLSREDRQKALEIAWASWDTLYADMKRTTPDGRPSSRQLAEICGVSRETARIFSEKKGVTKVVTPLRSAITGEVTNCFDGKGEKASALKVTNQHFEERNALVSKLLKEHKDRFGLDIPDRLYEAFTSREIIRVLRDLGIVRTFLEGKRDDGSAEFVHCIGFALRHLDAVIRDLREGEPYCVCRACRGIRSGKPCGTCGDTGFMTKRQYNMLPPEFKAEKR